MQSYVTAPKKAKDRTTPFSATWNRERNTLKSAYHAQSKIGWENLVKGRIVQEWAQFMEIHYANQGYKLKGRVSWTLPEQTSISFRLGFCAGVCSWDASTSSLKCQCCLLTFVCRVKATWKLSSMCLHTWGYITMKELCLVPLTPLLTWVP
jgi:hypothetical protein